jgi:hypothetical protein
MVGKSGIGVERFVDLHLHVEKLIRYPVSQKMSGGFFLSPKPDVT